MKKLVLFLLPLLAVGCAASTRNGRFTLKEPIYAIVDSFILRHSDKDLFELYIDTPPSPSIYSYLPEADR